jgi:hypothetical protein
MTLEELYNLANFIIRRTSKGRPLTSDRFVEMFNKRQIDYFQELYNRFESNTSITDSLRPFKKIIDQDDISIVDNTYFALPSDYFHLSTISYVDGDGKYYPFDVVTKDQVLMRKSSFLTSPSITYPICYEFNNNLYLEPYSSSLDLNISYLKYPSDVVLDYYISTDGSLEFLDASEEYSWVNGDTDSSGNIKTGTFNDWFLPSKDELSAMYTNLHAEGVGGFGTNIYWSSSESLFDINTYAWSVQFLNGVAVDAVKSNTNYVRACRTFTASAGAYSLRDTGPAGGLIFYIDGTTYYEAAPSDQSTSQAWSNVTGTAIGATGTAIGTGQANTTVIINQAGHTDSAAKLCNDLTIGDSTYTSLTTESEWNEEDELKVLEYILRDMGISLNDISVYQYAEMQKNES